MFGLIAAFIMNRLKAQSDESKFPSNKSIWVINEHGLRNVGKPPTKQTSSDVSESKSERFDVVTLAAVVEA